MREKSFQDIIALELLEDFVILGIVLMFTFMAIYSLIVTIEIPLVNLFMVIIVGLSFVMLYFLIIDIIGEVNIIKDVR